MRIEVTGVSLVSTWAWDIPKDSSNAEHATIQPTEVEQEEEEQESDEDEEVCGICRNRYDATCPSCEYPGSGCPIVLGLCNHNFHVHCIKQWLSTETSRGLCPLCRQGFQLRTSALINKPHYEEFQKLLMSVRQHNIPMGGELDQDMMDDGFIR
ncbi:unnamed protein product [Kluyveromyces dobzhanskii CBS 2104]|uniref:Anaphase-promoting complex subunit 11 n=1 Tax=Kluyveromyces dobzhanskii CBS 2104 TaxID=1427455 RepID=A0A0A8L9F4_9SACH|nr:unnamed protein product [Kluyveromyces dobzhanskii CBS 2104]